MTDRDQLEYCSRQLEEVAEEFGELIRDYPGWTPGGPAVPILREVAGLYHELRRNPSRTTFDKTRALVKTWHALLLEVRERNRDIRKTCADLPNGLSGQISI